MTITAMLKAGGRSVRRYPGLVAAVYVVQLAVAAIGGFAFARSLASELANRPLFDRAVDGDLVALATVVSEHGAVFTAHLWLGAALALCYAVASWFLHGGLIAAFQDPSPASRREAARRFGAGGAASFARYAAISLWSCIPYAPAAFALALGVGLASDRLTEAMTFSGALAPIALAALPGFALVLLVWLLVGAVSAIYVAATLGSGMAGAGAAGVMFALRQLVVAARLAVRVTAIGGQVALVSALYAGAETPASVPPSTSP
jgi:hypothetical protein